MTKHKPKKPEVPTIDELVSHLCDYIFEDEKFQAYVESQVSQELDEMEKSSGFVLSQRDDVANALITLTATQVLARVTVTLNPTLEKLNVQD